MSESSSHVNALVVGASQGIGLEFVRQLLTEHHPEHLFATYRTPDSALLQIQDPRLHCFPVDITQENEIARLAEQLSALTPHLHLMINCAGILHEDPLKPEKSLRQINTEQLMRYFKVNSVGSVLLAKHLQPFFRHAERSVFAAISAKVGSIGDNHLGGWYGYRASKAALNMLMRTTAIEYKRTCPRTIVALLHPGTTDTRLSEPFQRTVAPDKLFSVDRTVRQLLNVMDNLTETDSGQFFSWDGSPLPW
jgi:NAD(P)-dependent dehydrogenase (short-subunit alcohol dehydrogenase family)